MYRRNPSLYSTGSRHAHGICTLCLYVNIIVYTCTVCNHQCIQTINNHFEVDFIVQRYAISDSEIGEVDIDCDTTSIVDLVLSYKQSLLYKQNLSNIISGKEVAKNDKSTKDNVSYATNIFWQVKHYAFCMNFDSWSNHLTSLASRPSPGGYRTSSNKFLSSRGYQTCTTEFTTPRACSWSNH